MSLWIAVPCGIAAAIVYGASTAVQHDAAHATAPDGARGLAALLRNPRWLLSIGGDALGLLLQVFALATGPVVLVQPLLVLALPVALPVGWLLGGPRPRRADGLAVAAIVAALAVFFVLVGDPGTGRALNVVAAAIAATAGVAAAVAVMVLVTVERTSSAHRAAALGFTAGACFALVGVFINATALEFAAHGSRGLLDSRSVTALIATVVVGAVATTATQLSFQSGALSVSFPANESSAPVCAVAFGALLLHENVPTEPLYLLGYAGCVAAIVAATVQLGQAQDQATQPQT